MTARDLFILMAVPTPIEPEHGLTFHLFIISMLALIAWGWYDVGWRDGRFDGSVETVRNFCVPKDSTWDRWTITQPRKDQEPLVCDVNPREGPCL